MEYLTYNEYIEYGGKVSVDAFPLLEIKARKHLDAFTSNRITEITNDIKLVMVEFINKISKVQDGDRVTSFSNGKVSFSYDTQTSLESELSNIATMYLPVSLVSWVVE